MNSTTVMRYSRFPLALVIGFAINVAMFNLLKTLTSAVTDTQTIKATQINFTRLHRDTQTASRRDEERPVRTEVPQVTMPQLALDTSKTVPNIINLAPNVDMRNALKDANTSQGLEMPVTAVMRIAPTYPRTAKVARIEGYVTMDVVVNPDGTVADIRVVEAAPPRLFDMAAVDAMRRWKFQPKMVNGAPVSQRAQQTIEFKLTDG